MKKLGVSEEVIKELRTYDWNNFNSDRRFYQHLSDSNINIENIIDDKSYNHINTIEEFMDDIDNQNIYSVLINADGLTLKIFHMLIQGFRIKEISVSLGITEKAIYCRIYRFKNKLKDILK